MSRQCGYRVHIAGTVRSAPGSPGAFGASGRSAPPNDAVLSWPSPPTGILQTGDMSDMMAIGAPLHVVQVHDRPGSSSRPFRPGSSRNASNAAKQRNDPTTSLPTTYKPTCLIIGRHDLRVNRWVAHGPSQALQRIILPHR